MPIVLGNWKVCTPVTFRLLDSKHVDSFFIDGSLRLSSFSRFHKHSDEQRLDRGEGRTFFVHKTNKNGGQTILSWAIQDYNAYILSTSMMCDQYLLKAFRYNSYIRIIDSTSFAMSVSRHIPSFKFGFESPCLYQKDKIIERDLGYIHTEQFGDISNIEYSDKFPGVPLLPQNHPLTQFILSKIGHYSYFLKDRRYKDQAEYRYVWLTTSDTGEYIDIKVPEAIEFCQRPNTLTE